METPLLGLAEEGDKSVNNANKQNKLSATTAMTTPSRTAPWAGKEQILLAGPEAEVSIGQRE